MLRCPAHRACGVHASNKIWTSIGLKQTVSTFSLEAKKIWSAKSKEFDHAGAQCSYEVGVASTMVVLRYLFLSAYNSCRFSSRSESWPCTVGGFVRFLLDDCDFVDMSELNACKPRTLNSALRQGSWVCKKMMSCPRQLPIRPNVLHPLFHYFAKSKIQGCLWRQAVWGEKSFVRETGMRLIKLAAEVLSGLQTAPNWWFCFCNKNYVKANITILIAFPTFRIFRNFENFRQNYVVLV